ncbi:hypothetical protein OPT61_g293 [Boeremia exigua]|uniref:Uncharacterized protein n=1 Tax=Boeremia exigua TaxID=749465 RepID=A0ACC2IUH8_9PLEO|nr:hypothetical protein OPT61_g293 [Boeremia exigua]
MVNLPAIHHFKSDPLNRRCCSRAIRQSGPLEPWAAVLRVGNKPGMRDTSASAICTPEHVAIASADRPIATDDPVIRFLGCAGCNIWETLQRPLSVPLICVDRRISCPDPYTGIRIISCDPAISTWVMPSIQRSRGRLVSPWQPAHLLIDAHPRNPGPRLGQMDADCICEHIRTGSISDYDDTANAHMSSMSSPIAAASNSALGKRTFDVGVTQSSATLPTPRSFVTQLLDSLALHHQDSAEPIPLSDAPESLKKQLLSLQVLFPNEFLPALDLLDRRLVTRFQIGIDEPDPTSSTNATTIAADVHMQGNNESLSDAAHSVTHGAPVIARATLDNTDTVHYVRSAQQRSSRFSTSYDSTTSYEVRLLAWNCTCPAFAFAAFPSVYPEPAVPTYTSPPTLGHTSVQDEDTEAEKTRALRWVFGGVSLGEGMPPVCKHLLACVLAERCSGVLGDCMEKKRVSVEVAAGWAAGWGDS